MNDDVKVDIQVAVDKLVACERASDIFWMLADAKITGVACNPFSCPIATWLRDETGKPAIVSQEGIFLEGQGGYPDEMVVRATPAIERFITDFDRGAYPELERMRDT